MGNELKRVVYYREVWPMNANNGISMVLLVPFEWKCPSTCRRHLQHVSFGNLLFRYHTQFHRDVLTCKDGWRRGPRYQFICRF